MAGGRAADCYLQTDARAAVEELETLLAERSIKLSGYRTAEVKKSLTRHFEDRTEFPIEPGTADPREVCLMLDEIVPTHVPLLMGNGANNGFTAML
jgi:hypothetical protein